MRRLAAAVALVAGLGLGAPPARAADVIRVGFVPVTSNLPLWCGIETGGDARDRYSVRYYIVAMLFVVFDVETVFMFPWAVIMDELLLFGLIEMIVFLFILIVGYVYAWKQGALEWV